MKAVRAATVEGKCWKQELHKFLRQYRATPHPSTGFSSYHLMFGRASQTRLPQVAPPTKEAETEHEARRNDNRAKTNMKRYADARKHATPCDHKVGDTMLVKNEKRRNKLAPFYSVEPHIVTSKNGSMITARPKNDKQITRNTSCFKKAPELSSRKEERPTKSDEKTSKSDNHQPNNGVDNGNEPSRSNRTLTSSNKSDTVTPSLDLGLYSAGNYRTGHLPRRGLVDFTSSQISPITFLSSRFHKFSN